MANKARELDVPPLADSRAWITKGSLEVALLRVWDEPDGWGILLVDLARHASRAFARESICSEDAAMNRIRDIFEAEWERPTDPGTTEKVTKQ